MKKSDLARKFAKALVELAKEDKAYDKYGMELRTTLAVFKANPELYKLLSNAMYRIEERVALMEKVSGAIKLSLSMTKFLNILVETANIKILEEITGAYSNYEDEIAGRARVIVESPAELDQKLLDVIRQQLSSSVHKDIVLTHKTNPALLGGLLIRIGNTILDGSLKAQLEIMKEKILEGVV